MVLLGHRQNNLVKNDGISLFEIRLDGLDRDIIVFKGGPSEAPSVLLTGKIVMAIHEPIHFKKLSLNFYGDLRLNWIDHLESGGTTYSKPNRFIKRVYSHTWDEFKVHRFSSDDDAAASPSSSRIELKRSLKSSTSLMGLTHKRASSSVNLGGSSTALNKLNGDDSLTTLSSAGHHLARGNYEFPFSAILPGDLQESVEGLPGGSIFYKIEATLDRGKFSKKKFVNKHLRVVRSLTPDSPELTETMSIDNNWPKKVEYTISIPSRAVPIGSSTPINFLMAPLLKGLRLGKVTVKLVEYFSFNGLGTLTRGHTNERVVSEMVLSPPPESAYESDEIISLDEENTACNFMKVSYGRWEIEKQLAIPPSLSKCTQDMTFLKNLKVRHKLLVVVSLKNPNGHTSELRATLPVILYISPFVTLSAKFNETTILNSYSDNHPEVSRENKVHGKKKVASSPGGKKKSNPNSTSSSTSDLKGLGTATPPEPQGEDPEDKDDELLFSGNEQNVLIDASTGRPELMAPPNYGEHIYDKLWSGISTPGLPNALLPIHTPGVHTPGVQTPGTHTPTGANMVFSQSKFHSQLTKHLNELHMQRLNEESQGDDTQADSESSGTPTTDYFALSKNTSNVVTTPHRPEFSHASRVNSTLKINLQMHLDSVFEKNLTTLSKVPSYETATKSASDLVELAPRYPISGSSTNLAKTIGSLTSLFDESSSSSSTKLTSGPLPVRPGMPRKNSSFLHMRFGKHKKEPSAE